VSETSLPPSLSATEVHLVEQLCDRFEAAWKAGQRPRLEEHLGTVEGKLRTTLLRQLLPLDWEYRVRAGEQPRTADYEARFPENAGLIEAIGRDVATAVLAQTPPVPGPPAATGPSPQQLGGYRILRRAGQGGMGVVYEAVQVSLGRRVALKVLPGASLADPVARERLWREALTTARLHHPNIVQIFEVGEHDGQPFLALEFVAGPILADRLRDAPQPPRGAAALVETLARAVHHAHEHGIIHRDLKPANILLHISKESTEDTENTEKEEEASKTMGGGPESAAASSSFSRASWFVSRTGTWVSCSPKIADFGLAHAVGGGDLTATGEILGTPGYMAPEQAWGKSEHQQVGPATDVYALGAILYEALTGRPPFQGATVLEALEQVRFQEPVPPSQLQPRVPRQLETVCLKCLRKEPRKRYASAQELAEDLQRFLRGKPIRARPVTTAEKLWRWGRRHPLAAALLAAALLAPAVALTAQSLLATRLVRSSALESAAQQAELLEEANREYSRIVQRVQKANYPVNKTVPPTPGTVPLSIPATFLHDVGEQLGRTSQTGVRVRQYSDHPFPWRTDSGPRDEFEREALRRLRASKGQETVHEFTEIDGQRVVRYAQARVMQRTCVECHNSHPQSPRKDWQEGDVRGVLEIIRPLDRDEARVGEAQRLALLLSAVVSSLLLGGSMLVVWAARRRRRLVS
jgi:serine/threonine protein kinase